MAEPWIAKGEIRQEARRENDPTFIKSDDPEYLEEIENDEFSSVLSGQTRPKVLITTSGEKDPCEPFAQCLETLIPNSKYESRINGSDFSTVRNQAIESEYTDMIVLVSAKDEVHMLYHLHLPEGPSACYRITSIKLPKEIDGHARTSDHYPEIILKRFETRVGQLTGRMLSALFPAKPQYYGRRVITFHHQRDFIFFRHYRYQFNSPEEAVLQEAGPRFTLRLMWMQEGPYDPSNGVYTFYRRQRHEKSRLKWAL
ncbi:Ribosome production factor 1 [Tritrichomonas foetus]|uniref:Ribosome production factor 1 n=1 Tax=Tritrichomonas foetus TaxID=1144522 RepID=A0A1J4JW30_9EUKA|nr:Ribosome production factor 1 [Tritrichomonas foetus]|eukprot:OHT02922.1 Ribosome production factor 1 [Tritrichomonas foetus]